MMSDIPDSRDPTDLPAAEPSNAVSAHEELMAHTPLGQEVHAPTTEDIEREVAQAMAGMDPGDLAELSGGTVRDDYFAAESVEPGAELIGTVASVSDDEIILEFGAKAQGLMPRSQFGKKEVVDVGRRVDVTVERFDADSGLLIVNRKGALIRATWTNLEVGSIVEGKVTGVIKGGLELDLKGIRAFMPASQVDIAPMKDISLLLNETVQAIVIELDRRAKNVLLSRRKVMEKERVEAREQLKDSLEVGQVRTGVVKTIMDYGAFIDLGGIDGLAHIRDLSWGSVEKVTDVLSPGQEVDVRILRIDLERDRISLGLKQCQPDPWNGAEEKYAVGTALKARIIRLAGFGVFAELEPGIEGLIPISELGWSRVIRPSDVVQVGDVVDAVVLNLDVAQHRIAMSLKQAQADPWEGVLESFKEQSLVKGTVKRLADFGAFVELVPGVEGLIHISELADKRVKSCGDVVRVGEEVEARVLGIDKESRRIALSIKAVAAPTDSAAVAPATHDAAAEKKTKKRKKPLRGGLASHFDW